MGMGQRPFRKYSVRTRFRQEKILSYLTRCTITMNSNTFGFAFQTANAPTQAQMQFLLVAINDWATQGGGLMQEIARPNGFLDLAAIGAGQKKKRDVDVEPRSRGNTCPANEDILQYATIDVPDLNLNVDLRWGGTCDH